MFASPFLCPTESKAPFSTLRWRPLFTPSPMSGRRERSTEWKCYRKMLPYESVTVFYRHCVAQVFKYFMSRRCSRIVVIVWIKVEIKCFTLPCCFRCKYFVLFYVRICLHVWYIMERACFIQVQFYSLHCIKSKVFQWEGGIVGEIN